MLNETFLLSYVVESGPFHWVQTLFQSFRVLFIKSGLIFIQSGPSFIDTGYFFIDTVSFSSSLDRLIEYHAQNEWLSTCLTCSVQVGYSARGGMDSSNLFCFIDVFAIVSIIQVKNFDICIYVKSKCFSWGKSGIAMPTHFHLVYQKMQKWHYSSLANLPLYPDGMTRVSPRVYSCTPRDLKKPWTDRGPSRS